MNRPLRNILAELMTTGLNADQLALVTELAVASAADASGGRSKHAIAQAAYIERKKLIITDHTDHTDHCDQANPPHDINSTPPESSKPKRVSRSAVDVPETPSDSNLEHATSRGWSETYARSEWQRFRDWSLNKGRKHRNVDAAWRNWVTSPYQKPVENGNVQAIQHHPGGAFGASKDRFREAFDELKAFNRRNDGGESSGAVVELLPADRRERA